MTLRAIHDQFLAELDLEQSLRGVTKFVPPERMIALWMSEAQQEINDRLNVIVTYSDVSITAATSFTTWSLPTNFGKLLKVEIGGSELEIGSVTDFPTTAPSGGSFDNGTPTKAAAYVDAANTWLLALYPLPSAAATARVWYVVDTLYYSADNSTAAQNWGTYNATTTGFSGNTKLPERYSPLIVTWMLGRIFPDYREIFNLKVLQMKQNFQSTAPEVRHRLGGF